MRSCDHQATGYRQVPAQRRRPAASKLRRATELDLVRRRAPRMRPGQADPPPGRRRHAEPTRRPPGRTMAGRSDPRALARRSRAGMRRKPGLASAAAPRGESSPTRMLRGRGWYFCGKVTEISGGDAGFCLRRLLQERSIRMSDYGPRSSGIAEPSVSIWRYLCPTDPRKIATSQADQSVSTHGCRTLCTCGLFL